MNRKIKAMIDLWQRRLTRKNEPQVHSDVLGSYTGTPEDEDDDHPVQDADDL